jgi:isopentenyl diphosphate isomerase/L-lactate dehydrogenase-like FMN-dependent dehydrogenase
MAAEDEIVEALAVEAKRVLIGRPYIYGLAIGELEGFQHASRSLSVNWR